MMPDLQNLMLSSLNGEQRAEAFRIIVQLYAHDDARRRGLVSIFLDGRPEVIDFYRAQGFEQHTATLMRVRAQRPE